MTTTKQKALIRFEHLGEECTLTGTTFTALNGVNLNIADAVHDASNEARAAATNRCVRSNAAGEAPLSVPTGLTAGEYAETVQDPGGVLLGFAS